MRLSAFLLVLAVFFSTPAAAALPSCSSEGERQAMVVRALQSYFMVAGVACNQAGAYNKFITKYQRPVSGHGAALKSYFSRVYGGGAEKNLNDFITGLANAWSQIHMRDMTGYCKATWEMMWRLDKGPADPALLLETARQTSGGHVEVSQEMCGGAVEATRLAQR